jgi:1,2-diacylglycerol 3-alpha-glucosyltransferase
MRIIIASQTYTYGNGQASFTIRLAENLLQRGHQVLVMAPAETMHSYGTYINGVRVEKIAAFHASLLHPSFYHTPFPTPRIRQLFREFQPHLIHIQDHYFLCSAVMREARRRQIPCMGTNHFLPENLLPFLRKYPKLQQIAAIPLWQMMLNVFNQLALATTPSKTAAQILRGQKIRIPVRAISNGVDTLRFNPDPAVDRCGIRRKYGLDPDKNLFLYVGRLDGEKQIDTLIDAVALLPRSDVQLAIGGFGLYEQLLRQQVEKLGMQEHIVFIGYIAPEDLPALYNSADIFAMPSPEELQSIATLEAMACGKPILAANARALPELVSSQVNGYLFEPANAEDAACKMEQLLNERDRWTVMGQASIERAQVHSLPNTLTHYEEQYNLLTTQILVEQSSRVSRKVLHKSI